MLKQLTVQAVLEGDFQYSLELPPILFFIFCFVNFKLVFVFLLIFLIPTFLLWQEVFLLRLVPDILLLFVLHLFNSAKL